MQLFVSFTYLHLTKSYILQEYYTKQRCSLIPVDFPKKNLNTSKTRRKAEDTGILQKWLIVKVYIKILTVVLCKLQDKKTYYE